MEPQTLTDRIKEVLKEKDQPLATKEMPTTLANLESIATNFNLLPFVLYRDNPDAPEDAGREEYFYGNALAQDYFVAIIDKNMRKRGWSQNDMAKKIKVAPSTVSMIMNSDRKPRIATIEKMAGALGLIPAYLVPKRAGRPPLRFYEESFDRVVDTLQHYLIASGDEVLPSDLHRAIQYGIKINELTSALRVKYDVLENISGAKNG